MKWSEFAKFMLSAFKQEILESLLGTLESRYMNYKRFCGIYCITDLPFLMNVKLLTKSLLLANLIPYDVN